MFPVHAFLTLMTADELEISEEEKGIQSLKTSLYAYFTLFTAHHLEINPE